MGGSAPHPGVRRLAVGFATVVWIGISAVVVSYLAILLQLLYWVVQHYD
jgi:hypothetical protein